MTSVADIRKALVRIRGRMAIEQQVVISTMRQLDAAHLSLVTVWRGSNRQDLYQAAVRAHSACDEVVNALQQIDFADRHIGEYLTTRL